LTYTGYDKFWQKENAEHLPPCDWKKWKAQAYQESLFDPTAVSRAGARGLCQFMPSTWRWGKKALRFRGVPENPANAVDAQLKYMRYLCRLLWRRFSIHTEKDLFELALASYNAGFGNISRAIRIARSTKWEDVKKVLHKVTGRHSKETITYVERIWKHYYKLTGEAYVVRFIQSENVVAVCYPALRSCRRISFKEILQSVGGESEDYRKASYGDSELYQKDRGFKFQDSISESRVARLSGGYCVGKSKAQITQ
jgi:membrane-bound lytic murein transglycosylase F